MSHFAHVAVKVVAGVAGALSLYAAFFLYEDEHGKIQNKLEEWWVRVDDKRDVALSRQAAFMRKVARLETEFLDRLFGKQLFSFYAFSISSALSGASSAVFALMFKVPSFHSWTERLTGAAILLACAVLVLMLVSAVYRGRLTLRRFSFSHGFARVAVLSILLAIVFYGVARIVGLHDRLLVELRAATVRYACLFASFICDLGFIALTRQLLRWCSEMNHSARIAALVLMNCAAAFLLVGLPISWGGVEPAHSVWAQVAAFNTLDAVVALLFAIFGFATFAHHVLWPFISRSVYALQGLGIARRRKLFGIVGVALLGYAGWGIPEILKRIVETGGN